MEIAESCSWIETSGLIPEDFKEEDSIELLKLTHSYSRCRYIEGGFIIAETFIWKCVNSFKKVAEAFAYKKVRAGYIPQLPEEEPKGKSRKGKRDEEEPVRPKKPKPLNAPVEPKDISKVLTEEIQDFWNPNDETEKLLDILSVSLREPVLAYYTTMVFEVFSQITWKSAAKNSVELAKEIEEDFPFLQFLIS